MFHSFFISSNTPHHVVSASVGRSNWPPGPGHLDRLGRQELDFVSRLRSAASARWAEQATAVQSEVGPKLVDLTSGTIWVVV